MPLEPTARFGELRATGLVEVTNDISKVEAGGRWAVVATFEGKLTAARFKRWEQSPKGDQPHPWQPIPTDTWSTSLDQQQFIAAVQTVRERIAAGDVYQVNICRVLQTQLADHRTLHGLYELINAHQHAPFASQIYLPDADIDIASGSPELFLRRDGDTLESSPIKGTASTLEKFLEKDRAENVMIVDLVRNDLGRVCKAGSVEATAICEPQFHPGLVHLVSTVRGTLRPDANWPQIMDATFPPGSVVGAPKLAALDVIAELETAPRGPYCGAIGWIDSDTGTAELAVGIRTFWREGNTLKFGTGGGITWDSRAEGEWDETTLKASKLLALASSQIGHEKETLRSLVLAPRGS